MAGIKVVTDAKPETVLDLAWRAAQDLSFTVTPIRDGAFDASKGHVVWSMLAGNVAPHCNFRISAKRYPDGTTDLVLERNSAWTTGLLGLRRIKTEATAVIDKTVAAIQQLGSKVIEQKEI
jgi:hypothetical protein